MKEEELVETKFTATITAAKGTCHAHHTVGQKLELNCYDSGGLCGFFYHDIFPYVIMLQFGGGFPVEWGGPDVLSLECMDRMNAVKIELRRIRD